MSASELVPVLMFMTLGAGLLAGIFLLVSFLRKRRNREAYVDAFTGEHDPSPNDDRPATRDMTGSPAPAARIKS